MGTFGDTSDIISSTVDKIVTTVNETRELLNHHAAVNAARRKAHTKG